MGVLNGLGSMPSGWSIRNFNNLVERVRPHQPPRLALLRPVTLPELHRVSAEPPSLRPLQHQRTRPSLPWLILPLGFVRV